MRLGKYLVAAAVLLFSAHARATTYTITDLGTFKPIGLSGTGLIVGTQTTGTTSQAVVWQNGTITPLATPSGWAGSTAAGINLVGQVIGTLLPSGSGSQHAAIYSNGAWTDINGANASSSGVAIDGAGYAVANVGTSGSFLYRSGAVTTLPMTNVAGLSDTNVVAVGRNASYPARSQSYTDQAIAYSNGTTTVLSPGMLPGGSPFSGSAAELRTVSRDGTMYGVEFSTTWETTNPFKTYLEGFAYRNGVYTLLGPDYQHTIDLPESANQLGAVVGNSNGFYAAYQGEAVPGSGKPMLWDNGTLTDLNSVVAYYSGWVLQDATGIDDAGEIVGFGTLNGVTHGFLLEPAASTPEPSSATLLASMSSVAFLARRRRHGGIGPSTKQRAGV